MIEEDDRSPSLEHHVFLGHNAQAQRSVGTIPIIAEAATTYASDQVHSFQAVLKMFDWRHESARSYFSYSSAAAQWCRGQVPAFRFCAERTEST
jgi:hypothetical protein